MVGIKFDIAYGVATLTNKAWLDSKDIVNHNDNIIMGELTANPKMVMLDGIKGEIYQKLKNYMTNH